MDRGGSAVYNTPNFPRQLGDEAEFSLPEHLSPFLRDALDSTAKQFATLRPSTRNLQETSQLPSPSVLSNMPVANQCGL